MSTDGYTPEETKSFLEKAAGAVLNDKSYNGKQAQEWSSQVVEHAVKKLEAGSKPYKYVVTCTIMQKNGTGLHTASACFWDQNTDGSCSITWSNGTLHAIVTVFSLHL